MFYNIQISVTIIISVITSTMLKRDKKLQIGQLAKTIVKPACMQSQ